MTQQAGPNFETKVAVDIGLHGVSIVGVISKLPFYYTIGRHGRGLPELLVVGPFTHVDGALWLNQLHMILGHRAAMHGELISLRGPQPLRLLNVKDQIELVKREFTVQVGKFYRTNDYKVQQVLVPDRKGVYPPDCAVPLDRQPLLGDPL